MGARQIRRVLTSLGATLSVTMRGSVVIRDVPAGATVVGVPGGSAVARVGGWDLIGPNSPVVRSCCLQREVSYWAGEVYRYMPLLHSGGENDGQS